MQLKDYEIIAEVGVGIALPSNNKYTVKVKIADFEMRTPKPAVADNAFNRWNHRFETTVYQAPY